MDISVLISKGAENLKKYGRISLPNGSSGFAARKYNGNDLATPTQSTVICSLYDAGYLSDGEAKSYLQELKEMQIVSDTNKYAWCREERASVWATTKALYAFLMVSPNHIEERYIRGSLEWLLNQRNSDGGWGYNCGSYSRQYYTYHVMSTKMLAYKSTSDNELKKELKKSLDDDIFFLMSLHVGNGKWKSDKNEEICPASTLFAMCALKKYDEIFNTNYFVYDDFKNGIDYIRIYIYEMSTIVWKEDNLNWNLEVFLPGKIDLLLELFDLSDDAIQRIVDYLKDSYIIEKEMFGWGLKKEGVIYTWTTALAIKSLAIYLNHLKKQDITKLRQMEKITMDKIKNENTILKRRLKFVILPLCMSVVLNIILGVIWPYYEKIVEVFLALGVNIQIILYTIIGVIIMSIIAELTKKWFSRFIYYIKNY